MIRSVGLLAGEVGQRAGEHEGLVAQLSLAGRRALLLEAQPEPAQVVDQRAHLLVGELLGDQPGDDRPDAGRLRDLLGRGGEQRVDRAEVLREVAAGDEADALDAEREEHAPERAARARPSMAASRLRAETSP